MEKYDFKKSYKLQVSIVESDNEEELQALQADNQNKGDNILKPKKVNERDTVTNIYYQNGHKNDIHNRNNNEKVVVNNAVTLPERNINTGVENNSQTNSWISQLPSPQEHNFNSHPTTICGNLTASHQQINPQFDKNSYELELNKLSQYMINILKAYEYFHSCIIQCGGNCLKAKKNSENFLHVKTRYFQLSRNIISIVILPQGKKFDIKKFLYKTMQISHFQQKYYCSYRSLETLYEEIMVSWYKHIVGQDGTPVSHDSTNVINSEVNSLTQKYQNYNTVTHPSNNGPSLQLQHNFPNDWHSRNLVRTDTNERVSALQEILQDNSYGHYKNITQTNNKDPHSILPPNHKNKQQRKIATRKKNKQPYNCANLENTRNYNNQQYNSPEQALSNVPTTCVFQYRCPDYEVRLDVNTQVLDDVNRQNQINNHLEDPNLTSKQSTSNELTNPLQSTEPLRIATNSVPHHDASQILQEPTRSTSTDSGFMSPSKLFNPPCNAEEAQDLLNPHIAHVTSLNPEAIHIPAGTCYVCGVLTHKKCRGCFKYYYCTNECQNRHWSTHQFECHNSR